MAKKLNVKANFKRATSKNEVSQDLKGLLAIPLYLIPATIMKLSGWAGLMASFAITWGTGAIFDLPAVRRNAWGMAGLHLAYSKGSGLMTDTFGTPWQIQGAGTIAGLRGLRGVSSYWPSGSYNYNSLPDGNGGMTEVMARPAEAQYGGGVSDYFASNDATGSQAFELATNGQMEL